MFTVDRDPAEVRGDQVVGFIKRKSAIQFCYALYADGSTAPRVRNGSRVG
jgi:hypothetical protein